MKRKPQKERYLALLSVKSNTMEFSSIVDNVDTTVFPAKKQSIEMG